MYFIFSQKKVMNLAFDSELSVKLKALRNAVPQVIFFFFFFFPDGMFH